MKNSKFATNLHNKQIKKQQAFSNIKNKNWKTPKWKQHAFAHNKSKHYKKWQRKFRKYFFNKSLRKLWRAKNVPRVWYIKPIRRFRWRWNSQWPNVMTMPLIKSSFRRKKFFFLLARYLYWESEEYSEYFYTTKKEDLEQTRKKLLYKKNKININAHNSIECMPIINKKKIKKRIALRLKKFLYQSSFYFFHRIYKQKFNYKNNKYIKSFFFKSLEMSLIKFSMIDNRNWFNFYTYNQMLLAYRPTYKFIKSKRIKQFFDIFTKSNLFNQIKQINILYSYQFFQYIHNNQKIFSDLWENKPKFPWWENLMFSQQTYKKRISWRGQQLWFHKPYLLFTFKFYYRYKKPWEEKKKKLYSNFSYLMFNNMHKNTLQKPKRIKQLLNKIILPFYGHIKPRQIKRLYQKNHYVKSKSINSSNLFLTKLETRLDVLIYRLNLAPNILWARRLIRAGLVFLQRQNFKKPINNYFQKKTLYPIKLNSRFNLYNHAFNDLRIKKFYFKSQSIVKVNFQTKPGDVIQCHPFSLYPKWNVRPDLINKPVPPYLLTKTKISLDTEWNNWYRYLISNKKYLLLYSSRTREYWRINYNFTPYRMEWNKDLSKETTSFFLFSPQKNDFFSNDRTSSLFLNWVTK